MKKFLLLIPALFIAVLPAAGSASAITFESGDIVTLDTNVLDDAYIYAGNGEINATVFGDLYILGGAVTVNGSIHEDLIAIGAQVKVNGDVMGDVRVGGGQVIINGNIGDDLLAAGAQVDIGKDAVINGTVVAGSMIFTMEGRIKEDLRGTIGTMYLNGLIEGDAILTIEDTIYIEPDARIDGNLKYSALFEASVPNGSVGGKVSYNKFENGDMLKDLTHFTFLQRIVSFLSSVALALLLILLTPQLLIKSAAITNTYVLKALGVGILTVIVGLVSALILMVTIIGVPFAMIILSVFLIIFYFAKIFTAAWIANTFFVKPKKKKGVKLRMILWITLILLAYYLTTMIPIVTWFIRFLTLFIGVGAIALTKKEFFAILKKNQVL